MEHEKLKAKKIAKIAYAAHIAYCKEVCNFNEPKWKDLPPPQKESIIAGVEMHILSPTMDAPTAHDIFVKTRVAEGWKYGPIASIDKKEHPLLTPFESLPAHEKTAAYLFTEIVRVLTVDTHQKHG